MPGRKYSATSSSKYRYSINGQEKEFELNENITSAEYWEYDSRIGRRWNIDPLAHKFVWQSPYCAMDNNPILKNDPLGASTSPIYDQEGTFLGTDDQGLKGKAIVMKKEDFSQGMKHEDAMKKDLAPKGGKQYLKAITYYTDYLKFYNHYNNLPKRPDYDGVVTIQEGVEWAKSHPNLGLNKKTQIYEKATPNDNLYLDASKMDFGYLSNKNFKNGVGKISDINLFDLGLVDFLSSNSRYTTYALGRTKITLLNTNGNVRVENGTWNNYDWDNGGNPLRELLIRGERGLKGLDASKHGFPVKVYGMGKLNYTTKAPEMAFPIN